MVDYLNLTQGEQQVHGDVHAWHERQCADCDFADAFEECDEWRAKAEKLLVALRAYTAIGKFCGCDTTSVGEHCENCQGHPACMAIKEYETDDRREASSIPG